jgi:O-antigen/teichoic acid export membrane protein
MTEEAIPAVPSPGASKHSFFRQSGWLMIANIGGGVLMWAVHFLSKRISKSEYGIFVLLLSLAMCIPTMPLQMALAHQTAQAIARNRLRQLAGMIRTVVGWTLGLWLIASVLVFIFHKNIISHWDLNNAAGLYVTLGVVLLSLWMPIFWGVLQGAQDFLWLGWSMISNGIGRLFIAVIAVLALAAASTGMMTGVLIGMILSAAIAMWKTRSYWTGESLPFDWREVLREVLPPMLGFAAFQFLFTGDMMFVKSYFSEDNAGLYGSAGTLSRALMWLVGPLASVMFPRIVHSAAKSEKNNLMQLVFTGTAVLAVLGAISLSILAPFIVRIVYRADYVTVASSVIPWYAGAMIPLCLSNVLLNNLLARSASKVVPPLCIIAMAYGFSLTRFHASLIMVLQTMGVFSLLFLAICAWFTWRGASKTAGVAAAAS